MTEERIKELFSNEEYVKGLFELGSYEAASAKLAEDGVEVSAEELKKCLELLRKKEAGQLSDEELEHISGGFGVLMDTFILGMILTGAVVAGAGVGGAIAYTHC